MDAVVIWVPSSVPSAVIRMHVVVEWIAESCMPSTVVPGVIPSCIPSSVEPWVVTVIPRVVETAVVSSVISAIVATVEPWTMSVVPWVIPSSVAPQAAVVVIVPWVIPVIVRPVIVEIWCSKICAESVIEFHQSSHTAISGAVSLYGIQVCRR